MTDPIDLDVKKAQIQRQPVFKGLNEEELEVLASLLVEKHFTPGQTIVTEGDPVDSVYLIISGTADVRHIRIIDSKPQIEHLATLGANTAIGLSETGFYSLSGIRTATVVANDEMVTLRLSMAAFHGFTLSNSHVSRVMRQQADSMLGWGKS
jgi:CRP-like cAMP-binding protein